MKHTMRRQTIKHFIHTFMKDYDTEKAADRTMKSKYVPDNLKTQLVSAMSQCDATDRRRIERVARLGMFIDSSCNELVYYNTITTAVMRWTFSLYIDSAEIKRVFEMVMEDAGRICDDDIQFIMEKYRYLEETNALADRDSHDCSLMGFLKPRKHSPDTSLIRYYGQSLWLKVLTAVLRNSINMFDTNTFSSVFTGLVNDDETLDEDADGGGHHNGLDKDSRALYKEFRENRTEWLRSIAKSNEEKVEGAVRADYYTDDTNSSGGEEDDNYLKNDRLRSRSRKILPPRPPPEVSITPFDVQFDDEDDDGVDGIESVSGETCSDSDHSDADTVLEAPYTYKKENQDDNERKTLQTYSTSSPNLLYEGFVKPGKNTTLVATVTQQKKLHILDDQLKDILMEERTSKALSAQTKDPTGGSSITTVETTLTKRTCETNSQKNSLRFLPKTLSDPVVVNTKRDRKSNTYRSQKKIEDVSRKTVSGLKPLPNLSSSEPAVDANETQDRDELSLVSPSDSDRDLVLFYPFEPFANRLSIPMDNDSFKIQSGM